MCHANDSFRSLVERDVDSIGHVPVSIANGVSHTVGNFEFLANGDLICDGKTFRDMKEVSAGHEHMPASRMPGYGMPLIIGEGDSPAVYRFVQKTWYRVTEGSPPLGKSPFFLSSVRSGPMLVQTDNEPLELAAGEYGFGRSKDSPLVTLLADGRIKVFDRVFFLGEEIDISSPKAEVVRLRGSPHLAVRVPADGQNYLLEYPHALASKTRWLKFAGGNWYWQEVTYAHGINVPLYRRLIGPLTGTASYRLP